MMSMNDQVKQAVEQSGLTRYRICKLSGVSQGMLSRFMNGYTDMTLATLDRIAPVIGVSLVVRKPKRTKSR